MLAFLMMGQSNMAGRGSLTELPEIIDARVQVLRDGAWLPAREPVVMDKPALAGAGLGLAFGTTLAMLTGETIGLIPCAMGGSALSEWMPGEPLLMQTLEAARQALASGAQLSGVLWHQGEHDSGHAELAATYAKRLLHMMAALESGLRESAAALGCSDLVRDPLPLLAGELGNYLDRQPDSLYHQEINRQLAYVAAQRPASVCVRAADLPDKGDALHFSASAQRRLGVRYASAWMDLCAQSGGSC